MPPEQRRPCEGCGSRARRIEIGLSGTVRVTSSLAIEVVRKEVLERHPVWLAAFALLTLTAALVGGLLVSGWVSVGVSLAFAIMLFFVGLRAVRSVQRIEKYGPGAS